MKKFPNIFGTLCFLIAMTMNFTSCQKKEVIEPDYDNQTYEGHEVGYGYPSTGNLSTTVSSVPETKDRIAMDNGQTGWTDNDESYFHIYDATKAGYVVGVKYDPANDNEIVSYTDYLRVPNPGDSTFTLMKVGETVFIERTGEINPKTGKTKIPEKVAKEWHDNPGREWRRDGNNVLVE